MDYFIDNMLGSSRRGSTKSLPTSPAPLEPPLPSTPAPTRVKKVKGVKFPGDLTSSVAESSRRSKAVDVFVAAAVPLPDTPAPPKVPPQSDKSNSEAELRSPESAVVTVAESDYFSVAGFPRPASVLSGLRVHESSIPNPSAFFTPMSELPPAAQELPHSVEDAAGAERSNAKVAVTEQQQPAAHREEEASGAKEVPEDRVNSPPPSLHILHTPVPVIHNQPAIMIGLSGSPASGKTTLAHLLSLVLPPTTPSFIIHQDDFFVRKHLLIPDADGGVNVDYRRTVDFTAFKKLISYSKREGRLPPGFRSLQPKEGQEGALSHVSPEILGRLQASLAGLPGLHDGRSVGIVDGFLLYHSETIRNLLDIKALLRASKETTRSRRFERLPRDDLRPGQESHPWDTTEYFDRVLWRNYANEHAVLFEDRDVEGRPEFSICEGVDILVQPNLDMGVEEVLQWVVEEFRKGCDEAADGHEREMVSAVDRKNEYEACNCNEGFLGRIRQAIFDHI